MTLIPTFPGKRHDFAIATLFNGQKCPKKVKKWSYFGPYFQDFSFKFLKFVFNLYAEQYVLYIICKFESIATIK